MDLRPLHDRLEKQLSQTPAFKTMVHYKACGCLLDVNEVHFAGETAEFSETCTRYVSNNCTLDCK